MLPRTKFRGRRRFGPSSGSLTDLLGTRLAAGVGMPNPAGTCGELARTMEIDSTKAGASALDRSYAEITYVRGPGLTADLVFETITALPADVPAAATGIKVPAGCGHYTTRWRGMRTSVTVRPLAGSGLPHISGATVSGFTAKLDVAGQGRTQIRTLNIRSGSLLILVSVGGQGDLTARTAKTAADASAYAHRRLGSG